EHTQPPSSPAISCTSSTILRRRSAFSIRMNAPISLKPFESDTKLSIWAIDNALPWEPCGADAFGAPSKQKATGTCRNVGDLLQPARSDAIGAALVFLHLLEGDAECIGQLRLAHCKHLAAHAHPAADVPVGGVRGLLRGSYRHGRLLAKCYEQKSSRQSRARRNVGRAGHCRADTRPRAIKL